jgi:4a-hydroxytetrahydrobiopterin dehydratase
MDMLRGHQIAAETGLEDWRKLAQGLHARFRVAGFSQGARFVAAVGEAGDEVGHHPRARLGASYVDLELVSDDAIYREDDGTEHVVEWVTQQDVDMARRVSELARQHGLTADPGAVSEIELGVETAGPNVIAPVWATLLTGDPTAQGRGTPGDEVRDATGRMPNLMFLDPSGGETRSVVEVYVPLEVRDDRLAAVLAAGGTVVDDSDAPGFTVVADQDGNRGALCVDTSAVPAAS